MKPVTMAMAALGLALTAGAAAADTRICEGILRGPAGEHTVQLLMEDGEFVRGLAFWAPPNQTAVRGGALPLMRLYYRVQDFGSGARGPLMHVQLIHAARISDSRATSAHVDIRRYGETEPAEVLEWRGFAEARANSRRDDLVSMASSVGFGSPTALELIETAPQVESRAITDRNELISSGVWNLTYRVALDALFDRAFQEARQDAMNPRRCRTPNNIDSPIMGLRP